MARRKRGDHGHYDFTIRGVRYRAAIPEARTRTQAIRAETQAREDVYNGKFRQPDHSPTLTSFIDETCLAWSKKNKRSWYDDELIIKHVLKPAFGSKRLVEITPKMIRRFQQDRLDTPVKKGKTATAARQPASGQPRAVGTFAGLHPRGRGGVDWGESVPQGQAARVRQRGDQLSDPGGRGASG